MIVQIMPTVLAERLQQGEKIWLLDVRQPWEHDIAALADSSLIPLGELPLRLDEIEVATDHPIVVYCHHGIRSLSGAAILMQAGYTQVASLAGGIERWSDLIDATIRKY